MPDKVRKRKKKWIYIRKERCVQFLSVEIRKLWISSNVGDAILLFNTLEDSVPSVYVSERAARHCTSYTRPSPGHETRVRIFHKERGKDFVYP